MTVYSDQLSDFIKSLTFCCFHFSPCLLIFSGMFTSFEQQYISLSFSFLFTLSCLRKCLPEQNRDSWYQKWCLKETLPNEEVQHQFNPKMSPGKEPQVQLKAGDIIQAKDTFQHLWNYYLKQKWIYLMLILKVLHYLDILSVEQKYI